MKPLLAVLILIFVFTSMATAAESPRTADSAPIQTVNWLGHGRFGTAPHIIEVTSQKEVWTFADHRTMKTIATIQLLDVTGDATRGEILH